MLIALPGESCMACGHGKIRAVAKAFACRIVERRQLETITWGDFGSSNRKEFYDGCYKACPWLFHFRGEANDDCWVARLVIQQYLVQAKGYDPKRTKPREQDDNLRRNASKLAHKDVIPPKDEDPYYINVPEGGYGNGPKRLAKFKRSDSPSCGRSLSTQLPPRLRPRIATLAGQTRSFRRKKLALRRPSPAHQQRSLQHSREISKRQVLRKRKRVVESSDSESEQARARCKRKFPAPGKPPSLDSPRDRPSPSPPQDSPPSRLRPTPGKVPTKTPRSIVEVVLRSPAPVKPMEPCRKEPSKPAADPKETRRLKRKAENDAAAKPRRGAGRGQGGRGAGAIEAKDSSKNAPETRSHPEPEPKSQLPPPHPASESAPAAQPQPQPEGGKEHPDGGDGASSTKPSAPKPPGFFSQWLGDSTDSIAAEIEQSFTKSNPEAKVQPSNGNPTPVESPAPEDDDDPNPTESRTFHVCTPAEHIPLPGGGGGADSWASNP
ncbi:hypothetical protein RHS01_04154 [Rhizoctonia solani]|uniref:Uncharacterized protein n=1 Tax=Rhizoctonia solani TaxID=456999 RepID=A0A8H7IFT4_9AGAM|nr:hypothetical protein RHS01_04154 [Rhizoctonia solani]